MYKFKDIKTVHLEITSKCQASCPMCARNMQGGPLNPFLTLNEITYDNFVQWFDKDFIQQLDKLYMCGNFGDPIIAKDVLDIFQYIRDINPNIHLSMNTNGSARTKAFWESLADLNVVVRFGIDGLEDTHSQYRIGTNFKTIISNAKTFIDRGGYAIWDMLVFKHNEHQVSECRLLSNNLGFKEFYFKNTSRFKDESLQVINVDGIKINELYPTEKSLSFKDKVNTESKIISCKSINENSLYIGANGNVTLCCWTDLEFLPIHNPSRIDMYSRIGTAPNLHTTALRDIFESSYFNSIEDTWSCSPLKECAKQCGTFKKFEAQYED